MMMPMPGKLIIERDPPEDKIGSIIVPDTARDNVNIGTVVAVSKEVWWEEGSAHFSLCHVGDRLLVGKYSGVEIRYDNRNLVVLHQKDVLAVLPPLPTASPSTLGIHVKEDAGALA